MSLVFSSITLSMIFSDRREFYTVRALYAQEIGSKNVPTVNAESVNMEWYFVLQCNKEIFWSGDAVIHGFIQFSKFIYAINLQRFCMTNFT